MERLAHRQAVRGWLGKLALALTSTALGLLLLELGARAWFREWRTTNFARAAAAPEVMFGPAHPSAFDARLGWIPHAGP